MIPLLVSIINNTGISEIYSEWDHLSHFPVCSWRGLTCSNSNDVVAVDISSLGLVGSIESWNFSESSIKSFAMSYNKFAGNIPDSIGELNNLVYLDLGYNLFSGRIPQSLALLPKMNTMLLDGNSNITGEIPIQFCEASCLQTLYLPAHIECIPSCLQQLPSLVVQGSVPLCYNMSEPPTSSPTSPGTNSFQNPSSFRLMVLLYALVALLVFGICYFCRRRIQRPINPEKHVAVQC